MLAKLKEIILFSFCFFLLLAFLIKDVDVVFSIVLVELFLGILFYNFNIVKPFVWLAPFIVLYNISIGVMTYLGVYVVDDDILIVLYRSILVSISTLFFSTFLSCKKEILIDDNQHIEYPVFFYTLSMFVLIVYIIIFNRSGYTSKIDMNSSGGMFGFSAFSKFMTFAFLVCVLRYTKSILFVLLSFVLSLVISLLIGEREVFLCLCVFYFFILKMKRQITNRQIILFSILILLTVPVLGYFKQVGNKEELSLNGFNIIDTFFSGEFLSSGRNFVKLLENTSTWEYFWGASLFKDLLRTLVPPFVYPFENSTSWFNSLFYSEANSFGLGYGFSFLAEGYINAGYCGVFVWSLILSKIICYLYNRTKRNVWWIIMYIYVIPLCIYMQRGDLSYIFSPILKQCLLFYLIYKIPVSMRRRLIKI